MVLSKQENIVEVRFPKIGHFWQDSGLVGLASILSNILDKDNLDLSLQLEGDYLTLIGTTDNIQNAIEKAYDMVIKKYYDISTQAQIEDRENYNFYYDSQKDNFVVFPKKKARGVAWLIYDQPSKASVNQVKWADKSRHLLPKEYSHLQKRLNSFLSENKLKNINASAMLLDGPNEVRPKVKIDIKSEFKKKEKGYCCLCGQPSVILSEVGSTVLPLLTGTSGGLSFNSEGGNPEKACWKCALLGKFVPENGFYYCSGDDLFMFLPYSRSLKKMEAVLRSMKSVIIDDPNYNQNFQISLGKYFQKDFEISMAFFYTLFQELEKNNMSDNEIDLPAIWQIITDTAEVEFYVLYARYQGKTFGIKSLWPFKDVTYIFRFFHELIRHSPLIDIKEVMRLLVDYDAKNDGMTLYRNRICERILKKRSILNLIEQYVFHSNRSEKIGYIQPLFDFLVFYETLIGGGKHMTQDEQNVAVKLGRRLGSVLGKSEQGRKSYLYSLRRARNREDFMEQINRLQFRLGESLIIPSEVYEGSLTVDNFSEFKQFCMVAALNSFFAAKSKKEKN